MDRKKLFESVRKLRYGLDTGQNRIIDDILEIITGKQEHSMKDEMDLEHDVARVIKRIKKAKDEEKINAKARDLIGQIKKSLDVDVATV